jgi:orotidine-5'-phosphate decarboxylase
MNFSDKLNGAMEKNNSLLCIGLDPDPAAMPAKIDVIKFCKAIVEATSDLVCAYKLNFAFYEGLDNGLEAMRVIRSAIPSHIPVIGDAKRGDIGNTARMYARTIFDVFNFDAATVNPYLGYDSVEPFIEHWDRGVFLLCRTSNPGAADFQNLPFVKDDKQYRLYEIVAIRAEQWNKRGNIGLVVGATNPAELKLIRQNHPDMLILIPGVGAQGGDLAAAVQNGVDKYRRGAIISSSRQIIYASVEKDFAQAARKAAAAVRDEINFRRPGVPPQG